MKFSILGFFVDLLKFQVPLKYDKNSGYFTLRHMYFLAFLRIFNITNVSDKAVEKFKTRVLVSIMFFPKKPCLLWDNAEKYGTAGQATDDNIIRRMRFACRITKATDTHSEYLIRIAFPRQQWLRERASILRLYAHCLSCCTVNNASSFYAGFHFFTVWTVQIVGSWVWTPCMHVLPKRQSDKYSPL
jgi:hypothetical protein